MERIGDFFTNRYTLAYTAAVLLHLLFFLFYVPLKALLIIPSANLSATPQSEPMTFEFVEVPDQKPGERPPEQTPLRSDRQSVARDQQDRPLPKSHLPYSEGLVASRDLMKTVTGNNREESRQGREQKDVAAADNAEAGATALRASESPTDFASFLKAGSTQKEQARQEAIYGTPTFVRMDNTRSNALERGGLQLSTYDWEFAPYLAYLKRRIEDHIRPPAAFSQLGLIEGQTRLRFKIMRDGTLKDLEVLEYKGSPHLRDTSVRAVTLSADFRALPENFPDEYLEITGLFDYVIIRSQ